MRGAPFLKGHVSHDEDFRGGGSLDQIPVALVFTSKGDSRIAVKGASGRPPGPIDAEERTVASCDRARLQKPTQGSPLSSAAEGLKAVLSTEASHAHQ